jgi:hypothetical protein
MAMRGLKISRDFTGSQSTLHLLLPRCSVHRFLARCSCFAAPSPASSLSPRQSRAPAPLLLHQPYPNAERDPLYLLSSCKRDLLVQAAALVSWSPEIHLPRTSRAGGTNCFSQVLGSPHAALQPRHPDSF